VVSTLQPVVLPGQRATGAVALVILASLFQKRRSRTGRGRIRWTVSGAGTATVGGQGIRDGVGDEGQGAPPGPRQGGCGPLTIAARRAGLWREELTRGASTCEGRRLVADFPAGVLIRGGTRTIIRPGQCGGTLMLWGAGRVRGWWPRARARCAEAVAARAAALRHAARHLR
jgi:hypothetical protein